METEPVVLIVDDSPQNLQLLAETLRSQSMQVLMAASGRQGIAIAQAKKPDCILMDVLMPDLNGFAACKALQDNENTKDIPVIFLSALNDTEGIVKGFLMGAVDYVTKPFRKEELLARVKTHVRLKRLTEELRRQSTHDGLTGLHNHLFIIESFQRECDRSKRYKTPLSIVLFDIDHFKNVNDTHGHTFGDEVLRSFARVIENAVREVDMAGRYGGEEFLVVLPNTARSGAVAIAERIRVTFESLRYSDDRRGSTVSGGVAEFDSSETLTQCLERADSRLYEAKHAGRNCVVS